MLGDGDNCDKPPRVVAACYLHFSFKPVPSGLLIRYTDNIKVFNCSLAIVVVDKVISSLPMSRVSRVVIILP